MDPVKLLGSVEDFKNLKEEITNIVSTRLTEVNQIAIQNLSGEGDDWYCGLGSLLKLKNTSEHAYKFIQPSLKGSVIESIIKQYGGFRTRIMNMKPRSCYSVHSDFSYRIHIPIVTSEQCWMVWPYNENCYNLKEGNVYWTNTKASHSAFNGSTFNRIHLVMCVSKPV